MFDPKKDQPTDASKAQDSTKTQDTKADFPPPISSLFSFDLPGLAEKSRADKALKEQSDAAIS